MAKCSFVRRLAAVRRSIRDEAWATASHVGAQSHGDWAKQQPHLIWTSSHTIVDYLEEFHSLLMTGDYIGV